MRSVKRNENENENEPYERQKKLSRLRELEYERLAGRKENRQTNESIDKGGVSGYLINIQTELQWATGMKREWPNNVFISHRVDGRPYPSTRPHFYFLSSHGSHKCLAFRCLLRGHRAILSSTNNSTKKI